MWPLLTSMFHMRLCALHDFLAAVYAFELSSLLGASTPSAAEVGARWLGEAARLGSAVTSENACAMKHSIRSVGGTIQSGTRPKPHSNAQCTASTIRITDGYPAGRLF